MGKKCISRVLATLLLWGFILAITASVHDIGAQRSSGRQVSANDFPGADLGAKINAADRALGTQTGEILVRGGGTILTQAIVSSDHTLRFGPGTYVTNTTVAPILMKPRSSLMGSGWDAIIVESTKKNSFTVISAYNNSVTNGTADSGLLIRDIQIKGANPEFNSAFQAISLGNCSNCTVDKVWINGTRSIGIQLGGSGSMGFFADNSKVVNCLFTRVASQNLALVNGRNILFENNRFLAPGQLGGPGSSNIDLEPNQVNDRIQNVIIRNNFIDARESEMPGSGNAIIVQSTSDTPNVGPILVEKNTIIGGSSVGVAFNKIHNGIYVFGITMKDVTVRDNVINRTAQSGIRIEGTRIKVLNNRLTDVGGGGIFGFVVIATDSEITGNSFTYTGNGPADGTMLVDPRSRRNIIRNNPGWGLVERPAN